MSIGIPPSRPPATPASNTPDARLRKTAQQLEGVFVQRLFAAMRETIPEDGIIERSGAEDTFTQMLDGRLSEEAPTQWAGHHSIGDAIYQQLRQRLPAADSK